MRISPENQHFVFQKKLAFWEHQFWGSSMMTLSSFLSKFRSCRGKLIKINQNETPFCEDISQRIENDPGLLDLNDLNDVDHCGLCGASATLPVSRNLATKLWTVLLSGTLSLPKSLLHCHCQKNWFCGKVRFYDFGRLLRSKSSSWIHIGVKIISHACCLHHLKNMEKKNVKHDFGMKNEIGRFFGHPV